ncbi:MAG TPA: FAD/NAD(P)-binding protein [Burkholderiales bacterium]|nr:FAD/NAD(P)-binding protein [Burkholderiales bacterium]
MKNNGAVFSIVVVGGGAASVAFLHHFVSLLPSERARPIRISIIEDRRTIGPGLAYQEDMSVLLLNRPAKTMSASGTDLATFRAWLEWKRVHFADVADSLSDDLSQCYLPRPLFGTYLNEFFSETVAAAKRKNVIVESLRTRVVKINKGEQLRIVNQDGSECIADVALLCVGNTPTVDHYGLSYTPNYIHSPYPVGSAVSVVESHQRVTILGSSLTAVDVALSLSAAGHTGSITMISRDGQLPSVRGVNNQSHTLAHLTQANLQRCVKEKGSLRLKDLLRLLRKEMRSVGEDWRSAFTTDKGVSPGVALSRQIIASRSQAKWQAVLAATNAVIEECWHHLAEGDKDLWMRHFHRTWMTNRAPIPEVNALKLQSMINTGQLRVMSGIESVRPNRDGSFTVLRHGRPHEMVCDVVINATGACHHIKTKENCPLLWKLIEDGYAKPHRHGGVDVEFETASLVDAFGVPDRMLRVVGHVTSGTYYFTSSLEMISKKTLQVSRDIVKLMSAHKSPKVLSAMDAASTVDLPRSHMAYRDNAPGYRRVSVK